jgi:hypothetical protein
VITGEADGWLAREFAPHRMGETIHTLVETQLAEEPGSTTTRCAASCYAACAIAG